MGRLGLTQNEATAAVKQLNFAKMGGLIPVVVQDVDSGHILMQAFMNIEAFLKTLTTGYACYYSRKKKRLWMKGEESGHVQAVEEVFLDCDQDSVLLRVKQHGGACDWGYRTCFWRRLNHSVWETAAEKIFDPQTVYDYSEQLDLAIPTGSLGDISLKLLNKAGLVSHGSPPLDVQYDRDGWCGSLRVEARDPRLIPQLVETGTFDIGITGRDCLIERGSNVTLLADLGYNKAGLGPVVWVLAVPANSQVQTLIQLENKTIITPLLQTTKRFFAAHGITVHAVQSQDATTQPAATVELCETGETLRCRGYEPLAAIGTSTATMIAHNISLGYSWKRVRIEALLSLLTAGSERLPQSEKRLLNIKGAPKYEPIK